MERKEGFGEREKVEKFQVLQENIQEIKVLGNRICEKKEKVVKAEEEVYKLVGRINASKAQRDLQIGQNFIKNQQKVDKKLVDEKNSLENILVRVKLDYGKLSEKVQEYEDLVQLLMSTCRTHDREINQLNSELDKIKDIRAPVGQFLNPDELNSSFHMNNSMIMNNSMNMNNSFTMNQPIQLNSAKKTNRRSESFGGFK